MGGGLMGMLMKGGMNGKPPAGQPQTTETIVDDYDLARWQRADGLDVVPTMVQTVRADWERKKAEEQKRSPLKKIFSRFSQKKKPETVSCSEPEPRPAGRTIMTPEMKKASQHIDPTSERESAVQQTEAPRCQTERCENGKKNYLGLSFQTEIDVFFTANPVNSAILAVDSLGMGALTLNQVTVTPEWEADPALIKQDMEAELLPCNDETDSLRNVITQRTDTNYMNEFHKSREQQKYNVRIRE